MNLARRSKAGRKQNSVELGINNRMIYVHYIKTQQSVPLPLGDKQVIFPPSSDASNAQKN